MSKTSKTLGVVVVFALAAGTAWASIPDSGGVIHGCYKTDNGKLRVIDSSSAGCATDEASLTWNQTGPQGATGETGPAGPQGPPGPTRADERFYLASSFADRSTWLPITAAPFSGVSSTTRIVTSHLAAGNYTVAAQVIAENHDGVGYVVCLLHNGGQILGISEAAIGIEGSTDFAQTLGIDVGVSLAQAADVDLSCVSVPLGLPHAVGTPIVGLADIVATKVDTLTLGQDVH
jgi:hypothetical protein